MELKDLFVVKEGSAAFIHLDTSDGEGANFEGLKHEVVYYNHRDNEWIVTDYHSISPAMWTLRLKTKSHLEFGGYVLGKRLTFRISLKQCTLGKVFHPNEREMFLNYWLK